MLLLPDDETGIVLPAVAVYVIRIATTSLAFAPLPATEGV
jgi:hypothetical protein